MKNSQECSWATRKALVLVGLGRHHKQAETRRKLKAQRCSNTALSTFVAVSGVEVLGMEECEVKGSIGRPLTKTQWLDLTHPEAAVTYSSASLTSLSATQGNESEHIWPKQALMTTEHGIVIHTIAQTCRYSLALYCLLARVYSILHRTVLRWVFLRPTTSFPRFPWIWLTALF